eukprot:540683_1
MFFFFSLTFKLLRIYLLSLHNTPKKRYNTFMSQLIHLEKGDTFTKQADKKLATSNGFICVAFGQSESTKDEAAELYTKAGAQYKITKRYNEAGIAYKKGAEIYISIDDMISAKQAYKESGKCFSHIDIQQSIVSYSNAIKIDLDCDRLSQAARLQEEIAKMLFDNDEISKAIIAYEQTAEYYHIEHNKIRENKMLIMVAQLCGTEENWKKAANIFETVAKDCVDNKAMRWSVKEYLFKAALLRICQMCYDDTLKHMMKWNEMKRINDEYYNLSEIYCVSRQGKFIADIIGCLSRNDMNGFKDTRNRWYGCLENWKIEILHHILQYMEHMEQEEIMDNIVGYDIDEEDIYGNDNDDNINVVEKEQADPFHPELNENELDDAPDVTI